MPYPKIIHAHADACTGCKMCEMVCSLAHEKTGINPKNSRIRIREDTERGVYIPVVCQLCSDLPCIEACPEAALTRDKKTGAIIVDEKTCTACGLCTEACENNTIFIHPEKEVACVCDLCGGNPKCVEYCLQEALVFETQEEHDQKQKNKPVPEEV
jgi:Fe-S-cluster-containing hydrogenase component 2